MSHEAYIWAISQTLRCTEKMTLIVLADHHNAKSGQCNPSIATIAMRAGLSERCVKSVVKRLAKSGLVTVKPGIRNGVRVANRYELAIPRTAYSSEDKSENGGSHTARKGGTKKW